jgi:hypothetical protein
LARGFDARENTNPQEYDRPNNNPVCGQVEQECAVDQADGQDYEPNGVKSKRHGVSFPLDRSSNGEWNIASSRANEDEKPKPSSTLRGVEKGS